MPYKVQGSDIMVYKDGKWVLFRHCKSPQAAYGLMNKVKNSEKKKKK
jgi:hypothetical protein